MLSKIIEWCTFPAALLFSCITTVVLFFGIYEKDMGTTATILLSCYVLITFFTIFDGFISVVETITNKLGITKSMYKQHQLELAEINEKHNKEIEKLNHDHEKAIACLEEKYENKIEALKNKYFSREYDSYNEKDSQNCEEVLKNLRQH